MHPPSTDPDTSTRSAPTAPTFPVPLGAGSVLSVIVLISTLTWVGLARVETQTRVLEIGEEIRALSDERNALLQRLRRSKTERAFLRRPARIRSQADELLGMIPLDPARRQRISMTREEATP